MPELYVNSFGRLNAMGIGNLNFENIIKRIYYYDRYFYLLLLNYFE